jgi:hypothetical protein
MRHRRTDEVITGPREPVAEVYGGVVAGMISGTPRDSAYVPEQPMELHIVRRREPRSPDDLLPEEREQLAALFAPEPLEVVLADDYVFDDMPIEIEVAEVIDASGAVRFRLYGWNFGTCYLMPPRGLDVIAMGYQHDLEHWHVDQRPIFWAMDRAYLRGDHGFRQPLRFCWWVQECWDEIAGKPRGTVGSESYVRDRLARAHLPETFAQRAQ